MRAQFIIFFHPAIEVGLQLGDRPVQRFSERHTSIVCLASSHVSTGPPRPMRHYPGLILLMTRIKSRAISSISRHSMSVHGSAPRRRESSVEEGFTRIVVD